MSEDRPGEGRIVSSTDAKEGLGRTSFQRVAKDHVGERSNPTEWIASRRLENGMKSSDPTKSEKDIVFSENPKDVSTYRAAGMSDEQIYELLKDR